MEANFKNPADPRSTEAINTEVKQLLLHLYGNLNSPNTYECYKLLDSLMRQTKPNTIEFHAVKSGLCYLIESNYKIQKQELITMCASILIILTKGEEGNDLIKRMYELKRFGANLKELAQNICACENCLKKNRQTNNLRPETTDISRELNSLVTSTNESSCATTSEISSYKTSTISNSTNQEMSRPTTTDTTNNVVPIAAARTTKRNLNSFCQPHNANHSQNNSQSEYSIYYASDQTFLDI